MRMGHNACSGIRRKGEAPSVVVWSSTIHRSPSCIFVSPSVCPLLARRSSSSEYFLSCRMKESKIAYNKLQNELLEWKANPSTHFLCFRFGVFTLSFYMPPILPLHYFCPLFLSGRWVIEMTGALGTLYSNETYQLQVDFPENYPMEAPQEAHTLSIFRGNFVHGALVFFWSHPSGRGFIF